MKVLQINAVSGIRSTGRICTQIADYLNYNGNEGYIAYSGGLLYERGYKIGTALEIKLHSLCSRIFGLQAYFSKKETKKLLNYIEKLKPDVVHLHNLHGNYINLNLLLGYLGKKDIPTVITLHDCWFYTGKCTYYTVDECYKWQDICGNCPRLKKDNPSWFFDRTKVMWTDKKELFSKIPRVAVIGVSDWITNEAKKSLLSSAKIITRIYNWVDFDMYRPIDANILKDKLKINNKFVILGVASTWSNRKGLNRFVELSKVIQSDMVIILIGNIEDTIHLGNNIIHINETHSTSEMAEYYSIADVFINFSMEETFGLVTAEALSCGTPAIVMNSTASPELIGAGCGYVLDRGDKQDVIRAILEIKKHGKTFYSHNCINFARNSFRKDERIQEYVNLYKQISLKREYIS